MAKAIMIQGTMSNAGKSLIAAGLCRIFHQDGYRVAPFKSQNMALNSFITEEGLEMGRAQVMQAEAAGIKPSVRMNPILLKPTGDSVSQVIVNGEVLGNYSAQAYYEMKKRLVPDIMRAFDSLSAENDIIVIEGAGSPAEINLKENDIVNMGMARMARAPVLLAGDIDRGGVFAQLAGTMLLLEEKERAMVKGLIINKFRGDVALLEPGLRQIEEITGVRVLGTVPWLSIDVDDEDSLSERLFSGEADGNCFADIAVIRFPHISNFTDMNPLQRVPGLSLRYVDRPGRLGNPDMIILPGTKNTMGDLRFIRENGLEAAILRAAEGGALVMGICGGFQMLGESLQDPYGVEEGGSMRGMGLLPADTVFGNRKTRTQVTGTVIGPGADAEAGLDDIAHRGGFPGGTVLEGYEVHMGETKLRGGHPFARIHARTGRAEEDRMDGGCLGSVMGTYVHGIFDRAGMSGALARMLGQRKGMDLTGLRTADYKAGAQVQYDMLADALREALDMDAVYRILEEGI